jgi:hypothetical protein
MRLLFIAFIVGPFVFFASGSYGQKLVAGFKKSEYIEMIKITAGQVDNVQRKNSFPKPEHYKLSYRSPEVGFKNRWDLWMSDDSVAVISIRGTTLSTISWLANFYSAMVPATGQLNLSDSLKFDYHLADDPKAGVHIGWLIATAYLSMDILPKIDSCYSAGIRNFIILGHSQGGGIAYLMTAYLYDLKSKKRIPEDVVFKTYCSAAPKPGNLYFAYEYENLTANGFAFNVINTADWVPEAPMSIQTASDFNVTNPFVNAKKVIRKQKFPRNLALKHVYNQLDRPTRKAQKRFQKYFGRMASKYVIREMPGYKPGEYLNSNNYSRAGRTIILKPDEDYYKHFHDDPDNVFVHHLMAPYLYLANKLPE